MVASELENSFWDGPQGCHAQGNTEGSRVEFQFNGNVHGGAKSPDHTILCKQEIHGIVIFRVGLVHCTPRFNNNWFAYMLIHASRVQRTVA